MTFVYRKFISGDLENGALTKKVYECDLKDKSGYYYFRFVEGSFKVTGDVEEPVILLVNLYKGNYCKSYANSERQDNSYGQIPVEMFNVNDNETVKFSKDWLPVRNPEDIIIITLKYAFSYASPQNIDSASYIVDFKKM